MADGLEKQRQVTIEYLCEFAENRLDYYKNPKRDGLTLKGLLGKDVVMFAARGVYTADEYVEEAFRAKESSSEETVMGNTWQAIIAAISDDTLDSGDLMTVRDGALWVCELKAQPNTTNSASFPQELRELKAKREEAARYRRASKQPLKAAFCVMRSTRSRDEERVYQAAEGDRANYDLNGFKYRYLEGKKFWRWLADLDGPEGLVEDASTICVNREEIVAARGKRMAAVKRELSEALDEYRLPHTIDGVLRLKKILS